MSISEQARHQLHSRLEQVLGPDEAATLISYLPPVGWQDVATKRDLDAAVSTLRGEISGLRGELSAEVRTQTRSLFLSLVGLQMTAAGLAIAVSRLA